MPKKTTDLEICRKVLKFIYIRYNAVYTEAIAHVTAQEVENAEEKE